MLYIFRSGDRPGRQREYIHCENGDRGRPHMSWIFVATNKREALNKMKVLLIDYFYCIINPTHNKSESEKFENKFSNWVLCFRVGRNDTNSAAAEPHNSPDCTKG